MLHLSPLSSSLSHTASIAMPTRASPVDLLPPCRRHPQHRSRPRRRRLLTAKSFLIAVWGAASAFQAPRSPPRVALTTSTCATSPVTPTPASRDPSTSLSPSSGVAYYGTEPGACYHVDPSCDELPNATVVVVVAHDGRTSCSVCATSHASAQPSETPPSTIPTQCNASPRPPPPSDENAVGIRLVVDISTASTAAVNDANQHSDNDSYYVRKTASASTSITIVTACRTQDILFR
jgi:hypothetical protein